MLGSSSSLATSSSLTTSSSLAAASRLLRLLPLLLLGAAAAAAAVLLLLLPPCGECCEGLDASLTQQSLAAGEAAAEYCCVQVIAHKHIKRLLCLFHYSPELCLYLIPGGLMAAVAGSSGRQQWQEREWV